MNPNSRLPLLILFASSAINPKSASLKNLVSRSGWFENIKQGLERELKNLDKQIRESRKVATMDQSLRDKLETQKAIMALERTRNQKRHELFDAQDVIDAQREELIANIERRLAQKRHLRVLYAVRWEVC